MEYTTEYNHKGHFRFNVRNPPKAGTEMKTTNGEAVVFDEIGPAGMLICTRKSDGSQQMYFPHSLMGANAIYRDKTCSITSQDQPSKQPLPHASRA